MNEWTVNCVKKNPNKQTAVSTRLSKYGYIYKCNIDLVKRNILQ